MTDTRMPVLSAVDVSRKYPLPRERLVGRRPRLTACDGVSIDIHEGDSVGIVGESGSGKTTLARLLSRQEHPDSGAVLFRGRDLRGLRGPQLREFQRSVQFVFQDPKSSLDPRLKVGTSLREPLRALSIDTDHAQRVREVLAAVHMPPSAALKYPHQFSGGQQQRLAIARALAPFPSVLIADEPVSALDVSVQAQVLNLFKELVEGMALTLIMIAHDLSVVARACGRVLVMADGRVVEAGQPLHLFRAPQTTQARALVDAVLTVEGGLRGDAL